MVKNPPANAGDTGDADLIPGSTRSPGEGHGNPLQNCWPGESHGQRSLAGCSPWGHKESDMTEMTKQQQHIINWRTPIYIFMEKSKLLPLLSAPYSSVGRRTLVPDITSYKPRRQLHCLCTPEELSEITGHSKSITAGLRCIK